MNEINNYIKLIIIIYIYYNIYINELIFISKI